jgi:hypothetical protein
MEMHHETGEPYVFTECIHHHLHPIPAATMRVMRLCVTYGLLRRQSILPKLSDLGLQLV